MDLGTRIKTRREALGISQGRLSALLGYKDRSTIAKIESGTNDLNREKITRFARQLQTSPEYLLGLTDDPYDYDSDPEGRLASIPQEHYLRLAQTHEGSNAAIWHSWNSSRSELEVLSQMNLTITSEDPQIEAILSFARKLNAQGLERLEQYAEDLADTPKFRKK